jgi:hypothetical protein
MMKRWSVTAAAKAALAAAAIAGCTPAPASPDQPVPITKSFFELCREVAANNTGALEKTDPLIELTDLRLGASVFGDQRTTPCGSECTTLLFKRGLNQSVIVNIADTSYFDARGIVSVPPPLESVVDSAGRWKFTPLPESACAAGATPQSGEILAIHTLIPTGMVGHCIQASRVIGPLPPHTHLSISESEITTEYGRTLLSHVRGYDALGGRIAATRILASQTRSIMRGPQSVDCPNDVLITSLLPIDQLLERGSRD